MSVNMQAAGYNNPPFFLVKKDSMSFLQKYPMLFMKYD